MYQLGWKKGEKFTQIQAESIVTKAWFILYHIRLLLFVSTDCLFNFSLSAATGGNLNFCGKHCEINVQMTISFQPVEPSHRKKASAKIFRTHIIMVFPFLHMYWFWFSTFMNLLVLFSMHSFIYIHVSRSLRYRNEHSLWNINDQMHELRAAQKWRFYCFKHFFICYAFWWQLARISGKSAVKISIYSFLSVW